MRKIFASIDIGSKYIKIVVLEELNKKLNILASNYYPSDGIKKGMIIDDNKVIKTLKNAFDDINKSLGIKVDKVITSVPINNARYTLTDGYTTITNENRIISSDDILNALQASIYNKIPESDELVTVMPIKYAVDANNEVVNPRGYRADKLSVLSMMVTIPKKNLYRHISVLSKCGVEVVDILFNSIGDYYCYKENEFDKDVTGIINIGGEKTELTVFNKGIITNSTLLADGSEEIEKDISYVYNIDIDKARKLKEMFLLLDKEYASNSEVYETRDNSNIKIKINQYEASEIAENKLKEILEKSKKELNHLTKKEIRYIIITGGIANIPGFDTVCNQVFKEKAIVKPIDILGIRNSVYSSSFGMIKYFINKLSIRGREYTMFNEDMQYRLVENRKNNDDGFKISKLFGYFFDNKED